MREMLYSRTKALMLGAIPALAAALVVLLEKPITNWSKGRQAVLPFLIMLLFSAILHPRLRHLLVAGLCYGVAFMAVRDAISSQPLPSRLDYEVFAGVRPAALLLVAILAAAAAVGETVSPGTLWARRCYFGAAALYFLGIGTINYFWHGSWQSLVLCATGLISLLGCLFAHRLVGIEEDDRIADEESDETEQRAREAAHLRALRAKEWHDRAVVEDTRSSDRENAPLGNASAAPPA